VAGTRPKGRQVPAVNFDDVYRPDVAPETLDVVAAGIGRKERPRWWPRRHVAIPIGTGTATVEAPWRTPLQRWRIRRNTRRLRRVLASYSARVRAERGA
jgi:hypothetical protein